MDRSDLGKVFKGVTDTAKEKGKDAVGFAKAARHMKMDKKGVEIDGKKYDASTNWLITFSLVVFVLSFVLRAHVVSGTINAVTKSVQESIHDTFSDN